LQPVTRQPKPPAKPVYTGPDSPELTVLRRKRDEAAALLARVKDQPENRARVEKAVKTFNDAIARVEAREAAKQSPGPDPGQSLPRAEAGALPLAEAGASAAPAADPPASNPAPAQAGASAGDPPVDDKPAKGAPFAPAEMAVANADHAQRLKMPAGWFLQGEPRKYPVRDDKGQLSKALLTHAEERVAANKNEKVAAEARALLKQHFADKPAAEPPKSRRWI
jgi:hypothetical protein